jgi:RimJ/RimL family protein N-acetyltransferase
VTSEIASARGASPFPLEVRPGLVLEPMASEIAEPYFALVARNATRLALWEPWAGEPQSLSGIRVYLAWQAQAHASGAAVPLVIRRDGELVGSCSARIDKAEGTAEIGYWIDSAAEGTGTAYDSVSALVRHLEDRGDLGRIQARTAVHNHRSRALLSRLGFELEGVLRRSQRINGGRVDMAMYAKLPNMLPVD